MRSPDRVLDPGDVDEASVAAWNRLTDETGGSFFQTATWCLAWREHLAERAETQIALWHAPDGSLEAVAAASAIRRPILRASGPAVPVWVNTGSGTGAGDHLGWPSVPARRADVIRWAETLPGSVLLSNITPGCSAGLANAGFDLVDVSPTLAADLGEGDDWFPGSNDFRKKLRYYARQLGKLGVELEMVEPSNISSALFDRLLDLHEARSDDMGWGTHFDSARRAFHLALVDSGRPDIGPWMCVARRADEVVGILYGFRFGATFSYFQTGWSREFVKQSLGSVLVAHSMEWATQAGLTTFDFLRGDDTYKRRFGATPRGDETWMLSRGLAGMALRLRQALSALRASGDS